MRGADIGCHIDSKGAGGRFGYGNEVHEMWQFHPALFQDLLLDQGEHGIATTEGEQADGEEGIKQF